MNKFGKLHHIKVSIIQMPRKTGTEEDDSKSLHRLAQLKICMISFS